MADGFATFGVIHDAFEFMLLYLLVTIHANEEVHVREGQFGLTKLQRMAEGTPKRTPLVGQKELVKAYP
jgi:hypothetical protein